jgi:hypothetical protein
MVATLEKIVIWFPIVVGMLPLARILKKQAVGERPRGAHAKPSESGGSAGSASETHRGHAIRLAAISVVVAVMFIANPHGLVYWTAIGVIVVVLLWEPVSWLTAYLVRRTNGQDA